MSGMRSGIGDRPKRREDLRLLTGRGNYLDDLSFDGLAHAGVLRLPHAHARIDRLDAADAGASRGILTVLTTAEVQADGLQPLPRPSRLGAARLTAGQPAACESGGGTGGVSTAAPAACSVVTSTSTFMPR